MRLMWNRREGGPTSNVFAYGLEIKSLFSVLLLRFETGSREAYHSHAFNAMSWLLGGRLEEHRYFGKVTGGTITAVKVYQPNVSPIRTTRDNTHKVYSRGRSYVLSFRGPWQQTWTEVCDHGRTRVTLTHGRREVTRAQA